MDVGILKEFSKEDLENIFELKPEGKRNFQNLSRTLVCKNASPRKVETKSWRNSRLLIHRVHNLSSRSSV